MSTKLTNLTAADGIDGTESLYVVKSGNSRKTTTSVLLDQDNMTDGTTNKNFTATEQTKLAGIETGADVTDATNVAAAGAVMESDTSTADMSFVGSGSDLSIDPDKLAKRGDVQISTKADLMTALAAGAGVQLTASLTDITLTDDDVPTFLANVHKIRAFDTTTITLPAGVFETATGDIMRISSANANLRIVGAEPVALEMLSVASVTGSTGNWTITYNVTAPGGVAVDTLVSVGDALKAYDTGPIPILNGDNAASYVLRNRPLPNELYTPIVNTGRATISAGGGSISFAGGLDSLASVLATLDLATIDGRTRSLDTIGTSTATITGAWGPIARSNVINIQISKPNTGTITISGTTVTGDGTLFLSEANVGDMLLVDGEIIEITAIASDTSMTIKKSKTLGSATSFSILTNGVYHDGAHVVTAVDTGTITVSNHGNNKPPINKVVGGSYRVLKTVLKQTGTGDGITSSQNGGLAYINQVALVGPRSGSGIGLLLQGRVPALPLAGDGSTSFGDYTQNGYISDFLTGPDFGVTGFSHNAVVGHGCNLQCRMAAFSGATSFNVWVLEGGFANLRRVISSGAASVGVSVNTGGTAKITELRTVNNAGDGIRQQSGSNTYGEAFQTVGNGGMNVRLLGGTMEVAQIYNVLSGTSGFYLVEAIGLCKDGIIGANRSQAIDDVSAVKFSFESCWITGSGTNGVNGAGGNVTVKDCAVVGNGNIGLHASTPLSTIDAPGSSIVQNISRQCRASSGRLILTGADTTDAQVAGTNAFIDLTGYVGSLPTLIGVSRVNEFSDDGSIIRDGAASAFGVASLNIAGGSNLTLLKKATLTHDFGSIAAGAQATVDVTVTGAAPTNMVALVNTNGLTAGTQLTATILTTDTVRVVLSNNTAGAVDPGNATYTVVVMGVS